ncbi:hypothetical protein D210916BOD24_34850 [Alteromonas sp. D210916BOD_24]
MDKQATKEVVLIRHGKPISAHNDKINAAQYTKWVRAYGKSALDPQSTPKHKTHLNNSYVIVSPLRRAKLSAEYYGVDYIDEECALLREMDIPYYKLPFRLKAWHWVLLSRMLWFFGMTGRFESFSSAKARVAALTQRIEMLTEEHERLVLFGHGMTNLFTRKKLMKKGWRLKSKDSEFWGVTVLYK